MREIFDRWDCVYTRVGAIVALNFIAIAMLTSFIVTRPSEGSKQVYFVTPPAKLAAIVRAIEAVHGDARTAMTQGLDASGTHVTLRAAFPPAATRSVEAIAEEYRAYDAALKGHEWRVEAADGAVWHGAVREHAVSTAPLRFSVRLADGQVAVIERAGFPGLQQVLTRVNIVTAGAIALAMLAIVLLARQVTQPVRRMAAALASQQGGLAMADLPVTGTRELRDLAQAFNRMRQALRESADDRTRVLAAVAHDMRTYLTRIELRSDHIADARQRSLAKGDLAEMTAVLNDTLTFARAATDGAEGPAVTVDAAPILRAIVAARSAVSRPVRLDMSGDAQLPVQMTAVALRRSIENLVDNALRYGGNVVVTAAHAGEAVEIAVADDGPGVPEAHLANLTKPFFRLEPSRGRDLGGSGLGLAIVDTLVRQHGGTLRLSNRAAGGFEARVTLQARAIDRSAAAQSHA